MQKNQTDSQNQPSLEQGDGSFLVETVSGWLGRVFGCRHRTMSRPFSSDGQTYRSCVDCGARRSFSIGEWEMRGGFYYSLPTSRHFRAINGLTPRPVKASVAVISGIRSTRQYA
jgi:hypothetical protein